MCSISQVFQNKFETTTDEYIFVRKSLEMVKTIFIQGENEIALNLARHMCEGEYYELTYSKMKDVLTGHDDLEVVCRNIILLRGDMRISREALWMMREKIGQKKSRWIIIGKGAIPSVSEEIAVVEIRPERRSKISRAEGIEIEMLGPNCIGLTRLCLEYKSENLWKG